MSPCPFQQAARGIVLALVASCLLDGSRGALARDLPPIDRLADAAPARDPPGTTSGGDRADTAIQRHSRLGVPTFVWGQRGGAAGELARQAGAAAGDAPEAAARAYLRALGSLYGLSGTHAATLPLLFTQALPGGGALVKFRNRVDGVDVFREDAAVLVDRERKLVAVGGFVADGVGRARFGAKPADAAAAALADWEFMGGTAAALQSSGKSGDFERLTLPPGAASASGATLQRPVRVKPVLFRLPTELRAAWYVETQVRDGAGSGIDAYAYVIDDADRSILFRRNLTADAAFGYRVFAEGGGDRLPFPAPTGRGGFPHPTGAPDGYQPPFATQNLVTLANLPFSRNDPWLPADATVTTGNNVDAFADIAAPDGFDPGDVRAATTAPGVFDHVHDPALAPNATPAQIQAAVVGLFYANNWLHDWFYDAGFDELAGNAQASNYGRGGLEHDAIVAQGQDFGGTDNANMTTPADGEPPLMRMYTFRAVQALATIVSGTTVPSVGALFGPKTFDVTGAVAVANPADACAAVAPDVAGRIALVDRGACSFQVKAQNAQAAGAIGVIVADTVAGPLIAYMIGDGSADPLIPSTFVALADGDAIRTALAGGPVTGTLVSRKGPNRDGTLDNTIVAHEWGHYLSNRLIGDAAGISGTQANGMGEGWSDFVALLVLAEGSDAELPGNAHFNGTYAIGGYVYGGPPSPPTNGPYYGIRRYPYSRDLAKNPLLYRHVTAGVALPLAPAPSFGDGSGNAEVHNSGEVWASMLWECYANLLDDNGRLAFAEAQARMRRYLVTGMKLTPPTPTFIEARDALLAAMAVEDSRDYAVCLQGFAKRGMGLGAVAPDRYDPTNAGAVESFGTGGALAIVSATISDVPAACDVDGILDNGENGALAITLRNVGTTTLGATTGSIEADNPHVIFPAGSALSIPPTAAGQTIVLQVPVQLANAAAAESAAITIAVDDPGFAVPGPVVATQGFRFNIDQRAAQSANDDVEMAATAWTTGTTYSGSPAFLQWQRIAVTDTDHRWHGPDAELAQLTWLESPPLAIAPTGSFAFTFRHRFHFEFDQLAAYDGGKLQISGDDGASWSDIGAYASPGYNGIMFSYFGNENPLAGQSAYVRRNAAWPALETVSVDLGDLYAGRTVRIRFLIANDNTGSAAGWEIDDIAFANITNKPFGALVANAAKCYSLKAKAGSQQWAPPGMPFATRLQALVRSKSGTPLAGVAVTFSSPVGGPSATFAGAQPVLTDATGVALAPPLTANAAPGSFVVTATAGTQSTTFVLTNAMSRPTLDVDGNGVYDALTDGLLLLRFLEGNPANTASDGALGADPARTPGGIAQYLGGIRPLLDIDGDGQSAAATDGLLALRYLFGFRGDALIAGALGAGATRATAAEIEAWLEALVP